MIRLGNGREAGVCCLGGVSCVMLCGSYSQRDHHPVSRLVIKMIISEQERGSGRCP